MKRGDRITLVYPGTVATLEHGRVIESLPDSQLLLLGLRDVPFSKIALYTNTEYEHITWVHGWLRQWWPPDRQRARALLAAYALGDARIELRAATIVGGHIGFVTDADKLVDDFNRVFLDFQKVIEGVERSLKK